MDGDAPSTSGRATLAAPDCNGHFQGPVPQRHRTGRTRPRGLTTADLWFLQDEHDQPGAASDNGEDVNEEEEEAAQEEEFSENNSEEKFVAEALFDLANMVVPRRGSPDSPGVASQRDNEPEIRKDVGDQSPMYGAGKRRRRRVQRRRWDMSSEEDEQYDSGGSHQAPVGRGARRVASQPPEDRAAARAGARGGGRDRKDSSREKAEGRGGGLAARQELQQQVEQELKRQQDVSSRAAKETPHQPHPLGAAAAAFLDAKAAQRRDGPVNAIRAPTGGGRRGNGHGQTPFRPSPVKLEPVMEGSGVNDLSGGDQVGPGGSGGGGGGIVSTSGAEVPLPDPLWPAQMSSMPSFASWGMSLNMAGLPSFLVPESQGAPLRRGSFSVLPNARLSEVGTAATGVGGTGGSGSSESPFQPVGAAARAGSVAGRDSPEGSPTRLKRCATHVYIAHFIMAEQGVKHEAQQQQLQQQQQQPSLPHHQIIGPHLSFASNDAGGRTAVAQDHNLASWQQQQEQQNGVTTSGSNVVNGKRKQPGAEAAATSTPMPGVAMGSHPHNAVDLRGDLQRRQQHQPSQWSPTVAGMAGLHAIGGPQWDPSDPTGVKAALALASGGWLRPLLPLAASSPAEQLGRADAPGSSGAAAVVASAAATAAATAAAATARDADARPSSSHAAAFTGLQHHLQHQAPRMPHVAAAALPHAALPPPIQHHMTAGAGFNQTLALPAAFGFPFGGLAAPRQVETGGPYASPAYFPPFHLAGAAQMPPGFIMPRAAGLQTPLIPPRMVLTGLNGTDLGRHHHRHHHQLPSNVADA